MVKNKGKRSLIIALSIAAVLVVAIIAVVVIKALGGSNKDPYIQNTTNTSSEQGTATPDEDNAQSEATPPVTEEKAQSAVDPATLTTVDISPMSITVSYVKGIGGFEYEVLRAQNGTRYVQFSSPELAGTKCTNDTGVFTSILASPTEAEGSTLAKKITVDGTEYGLSLAGATCASDTAKLQKFQQSFIDGFSSLKKMN